MGLSKVDRDPGSRSVVAPVPIPVPALDHLRRWSDRTQQSASIAATALALIVENGAAALTMAAIASAAGISRQTLYRYYPDIDAVLVGVAEFVASHDEQFEAAVLQQADPRARLDVFVRTVILGGGHGKEGSESLRVTLPPRAREVLARHEDRIARLLAEILQAGIDDGAFRHDLRPSADAPLILGLVAAADPRNPERAIALVHRIVRPDPEETQP